jgi:quercetin dioxygenase-like cupin family protein
MTTTTTSLADGTMVDRMAQFDLNHEIADAAAKRPWPSGHYAKMLFKKHDLRVLLITMDRGSHMKEHHADGSISVQVLKGKIRINVGGNRGPQRAGSLGQKSHELATGNLFTLAASIRHDVEAVEDAAFLLTISWPSTEELAAMKHRGYGS